MSFKTFDLLACLASRGGVNITWTETLGESVLEGFEGLVWDAYMIYMLSHPKMGVSINWGTSELNGLQ